MSHKPLRPLALLTLVTLLGAGVTLFGQEPAEKRPTVTVDPLTGQRLSVAQPVEEEQEEPRADLTKANELIRAGDYSGADDVLVALQEEFPDDPRILFMRGEVVLSLSRPAEALPLLERAIELDAEQPRVHFQLAVALLRTGDRERALDAFAKEIDNNDDAEVKIMSRLNRTQILAQTRQWGAAAAELEAVIELDPTRVEAYGDIASFYLEEGELEQAAQSLVVGLEKGFRSARHQYILGTRYYEKKDYDAAIGAYRRALEIEPELAEAERGLGGALDQLGQEQEALAHLKRYITLKPGASDAGRINERIRDIEGG